MSTPCVSLAETRGNITVTPTNTALLRHVYKFCWRATAGSDKSGDPILHREHPHIKKT
jgi:hypothetical protein